MSLTVLLLNDGKIFSSELMSKQSFRKDVSWCKVCLALFVIFGFSNVTVFKVQHMYVKLSYKLGKNDRETKALHLASNEETMSTTQ